MKWSIRLRPGRFFTVSVNIFLFSSEVSFGHLWVHVLLRIIWHLQDEPKATCQPPQGDVTMEAIVKARSGSVLGKGSILKMYFFPGQRRSSSMNFRGTPHVIKVLGCVTNQCELHLFSGCIYCCFIIIDIDIPVYFCQLNLLCYSNILTFQSS
jgi:hypothetical protein